MIEKNCTTCSLAIFCDFWGEYKCKERKEWVHDVNSGRYCSLYKQGEPSDKCHCEDCMTKMTDE